MTAGLLTSLRDVLVRRGPRTVLAIEQLAFPDGHVTAVVGPNGAGKTTLLRLLGGLERPARGEVLVAGMPPAELLGSPRGPALAFQRATFLAGTVGANLALALRLRGVDRAAWDARVTEAAAACGVGHLLDRRANALSGGEAQRVSLARALALRAPLTLLDEPLSGLDGPARRDLLFALPGLLRAFASTVVLVTHDRDEALRLADYLVVLLDGRVAAAGPAATVFRSPPSAGCAAFLGYTVIPGFDGTVVAVAPRALRLGHGDVEFPLVVERVVDLGHRAELVGTVEGVNFAVRVSHDHESRIQPADRVTVSAPASAVVRFPGP